MSCEHKWTHHSGCDDCPAVWCWVCAGYHEPEAKSKCATKLRCRVTELEFALFTLLEHAKESGQYSSVHARVDLITRTPADSGSGEQP